MREIEFRGKKVDNSEWVYGDLHHGFLGLNTYINGRQVTTETIGQFTGLLDKNGQKIYEGDILRQTGFFLTRQYDEVVTFVDGGFYPFCIKGWECELDSDTYEVIGNIHENPELLKEE